MSYRSASRDILYTAPPSGDDENRDEDATADEPETADEQETPELDSTTAVTDANWTGTVPADD